MKINKNAQQKYLENLLAEAQHALKHGKNILHHKANTANSSVKRLAELSGRLIAARNKYYRLFPDLCQKLFTAWCESGILMVELEAIPVKPKKLLVKNLLNKKQH